LSEQRVAAGADRRGGVLLFDCSVPFAFKR
jgi:hypothetical protein